MATAKARVRREQRSYDWGGRVICDNVPASRASHDGIIEFLFPASLKKALGIIHHLGGGRIFNLPALFSPCAFQTPLEPGTCIRESLI